MSIGMDLAILKNFQFLICHINCNFIPQTKCFFIIIDAPFYQGQFCCPICYPNTKMGPAKIANPLISLEPARGVEPRAC